MLFNVQTKSGLAVFNVSSQDPFIYVEAVGSGTVQFNVTNPHSLYSVSSEMVVWNSGFLRRSIP